MKINALLISLLLFWLCGFSVENLEFEIINSNNGLSSEEVRDIHQDHLGYMWIITPNGLNRFDGYQFKTYKPGILDMDFPTTSYECISGDSLDRIWFGTLGQGVFILDQASQQLFSLDSLIGPTTYYDHNIRSLLNDSEGNMWIGTEYGLYKYNLSSMDFTFYNLGELELHEPHWCIIEDLMEDSRGNIWIATWSQGLFVYDPKRDQLNNYKQFDASNSTFNSNRIKSLFEDKSSNIWIGTWEDGLYSVTLDQDELIIQETFLYDNTNLQSIGGDIVYAINQDNNGNIWVGTPYGLTIIHDYDGPGRSFLRYSYDYNSSQGLSNNEVWTIYKDYSGLMWIGTLEGGVSKVNPDGKMFAGYGIPPVSEQIQSQTVKSFCNDPGEKLLLGVKSLGFGEFDLDSKIYTPYTQIDKYNSLPEDINSVNSMLLEEDRLWLGTRYKGLLVYNYSDSRFQVVNEFSEDFLFAQINALMKGSDGSVWAATDDGLYRIEHCLEQIDCFRIHRIEGLAGEHIVALLEDKDHNIWVGTAEHGINKIEFYKNSNIVRSYSLSSGNSPTDAVLYLYQDSRGRIWAGTANKNLLLFQKTNNQFSQIGILPNTTDAVYGIVEDQESQLWITTNDGLTRLVTSDNSIIVDNYTVADGLQGNIFVPGAVFTFKSQIFVGCYFGFNAFYPADIKPNKFVPNTTVTDILVNNEPIHFIEEDIEPLILRHNEKNISFLFSAMSFHKPEKNMYSYKLEGYDPEWRYADANIHGAQYSNLEPGFYLFKVKSANSSGLWNTDALELSIEVLSAPWKTWWAYGSYVFVFIFILFSIFRYLITNERIKKEYEIQKIEHTKTERLNQFKLNFFTNISHELLTPLSVMSCALEVIRKKSRKNREEMNILDRNVVNLNNLLQQLLDFRKMEEGHLRLLVNIGDIHETARELTMNFKPMAAKKNISLSFSAGGRSDKIYFDSDKIEKMLRNLISNALKYTPRDGFVSVRSFIQEKDEGTWLNISVQDSGPGIPTDKLKKIFERFYQTEYDQDHSGFGIGLALANNLVKVHKGSINVYSTVNRGATFRITIPGSKHFYSNNELNESLEDVVHENLQENNVKYVVQPANRSDKANKMKLLIADDNADFREVIKSYFSEQFLIVEAENGQQALVKAMKVNPDLIISDVMMPEMNGLDLCKELKSNVDTKYTPIILLTAKNASDEQSQGYKAGADSYITKPVSLSLLESRIHALLIKRVEYVPFQKVEVLPQSRYPKLSPVEFLAKVESHINDHLNDPEFSVKELCGLIGASESMLYRKVKQVSNLSPVELIRKIRLNAAASMLKKGNMNINEVAYETGFSDQSYFSQCFKRKFAMTPRQYINVHSEKQIHMN